MVCELWKPIPDYDYAVSNLGRVKRTKGRKQGARAGRILKARIHKHGYLQYNLWKNNKGRLFSANRLVALAFLGPPPSKKHDAAHWDGNPKNNKPSNIRWATRKQNMADAKRHGSLMRGENHYAVKLSDKKIRRIRLLGSKNFTHKKIAEIFKVTRTHISAILSGKHWSHVNE